MGSPPNGEAAARPIDKRREHYFSGEKKIHMGVATVQRDGKGGREKAAGKREE